MVTTPRLHVVMIVVSRACADHVSEFIGVDLPVVMIVMDNVGVSVAVHLCHPIFVVVGEDSCVGGQHERRRTEKRKQLFHDQFGVSRVVVIQWASSVKVLKTLCHAPSFPGVSSVDASRNFPGLESAKVAFPWASVVS